MNTQNNQNDQLNTARIRVVLVDDHILVRDGIAAYLNHAKKKFDVIGYASNGLEAVELCKKKQPDVVLMDISMPVMGGIEATALLKKEGIATHVLALSLYNEAEYTQKMMQAGALGYVLKDISFDELIVAIKMVAQGRGYLGSGVAETLFSKPKASIEKSPLTPRQEEVLEHLVNGLRNKEIGKKLYISIRTVEAHRQQIYKKLNIRTLADLIK